MKQAVTEYKPQATVIFVKKFSDSAVDITPEDIIGVASNIGEVNEISSIDVELTVKNNPGTFSVSIMDTHNKFIIPDNPLTEIPALAKNSHRKTVHNRATVDNLKNLETQSTGYSTKANAGTFFEFASFEDWKSFKHIYVISESGDDVGAKYPTQYIRNTGKGGAIIERWAIDTSGGIIHVCTDANQETALQKALAKTPTTTMTFSVFVDGKTTPKKFRVGYALNSDFIDKFKDTYEQGEASSTYNRGRCSISPMDRVVIFLSERFPDDVSDTPKLIQAFTGVVSGVQQGYSENKSVLSIKGEDVTKYLQVSVINANPALQITAGNPVDQMPGENITIWSNIFNGMTIPGIVKALLLGHKEVGEKGFTQTIDGVPSYKLTTTPGMSDLKYDATSGSWVYTGKKSHKNYITASFSDAMGALFTKSSVHVYDIFNKQLKLRGFNAYRLNIGANFSFFQADFKTRREILYKCAEDSNYGFFADRRGDLWFRPQLLNNSHILCAENPEVYVIRNKDIISFAFIEDDSRVYTSVYVQTEPPLGLDGNQSIGGLAGSYRDEVAILKYGLRIFATSNPIIREKGTGYKQIDSMTQISRNTSIYAKSLLQRLLSSKYQGQIQIPGRVEIEPGYPVYIPVRNMVYYVETVSHSFSYGSSFTTTLHLNYGRKPWEHIAEILTYSDTDDMYLTDGYLFTNLPEQGELTSSVEEEIDNPDYYGYNPTTHKMNPKNLVTINIGGTAYKVNSVIAMKIMQADNALYAAKKHHLKIISAFRTYEVQAKLYAKYKSGKGGKAAAPGNSNHETGMAIDVSNWNEAAPYLHAVGLYNNIPNDRVHFSLTGR